MEFFDFLWSILTSVINQPSGEHKYCASQFGSWLLNFWWIIAWWIITKVYKICRLAFQLYRLYPGLLFLWRVISWIRRRM